MGRRKARRAAATTARAAVGFRRKIGREQTRSCGKDRYTSRRAAEAAAVLKAERPTYPDELAAYYHRPCGAWHLTSRPRRP